MASGKKDSFENALLLLIFQNTNIANIGDGTGLRGSSTAGNFYIALYKNSAKPTDSVAGTEVTYTNYTRVAVARTAGGWTVSSNNAYNTSVVTFPTCGATGDTAGAAAICKAGTTGVDDAIYYGDLTADLVIAQNGIPEIAAGDLDIFED